MISVFMGRLRQMVIGRWIRSRISTWPWYQHMPGKHLLLHNFKLKLRVLLSLISETARMTQETRNKIKRTRALKDSVTAPVLVIGSGPSVKNLTPRQIVQFRDSGGKIAVMNGFADSYLAEIINPDYYFIMDLDYWRSTNPNDLENLARIRDFLLRQSPDCTFVQPADQVDLFEGHPHYVYIDGRSVAGLYRKARPDQPWGLPGSVAMTAIATLRFLGHSIIYFTGLDSDASRHYFVNDLNQLIWDSKNYYYYEDRAFQEKRSESLEPGVLQVPAGLLNNFADVLYSDAVFRRDLYWLLSDKCVNVGNDHTNDAAPRACLLGGDPRIQNN